MRLATLQILSISPSLPLLLICLAAPLPLLAQTQEGESFDGSIPPPLPIALPAWWQSLLQSPWFWISLALVLLVALGLKRWWQGQALASPPQPLFPPLPEAMQRLDAILSSQPSPPAAEVAGEIWWIIRRYLSRRYRHPLESRSVQEIFFPANGVAVIPDTAQRRFLPLARVCEKLAFSRPGQVMEDVNSFVENARDCLREDAREPYA